MGFLERLRVRLTAAAKSLEGFDFKQSQYENAASYREAVDLFFVNLLRSMREALDTFATVEASASPKLFLKRLREFHKEMHEILETEVQNLVKIAQLHDTPADPEKRAQLEASKKDMAARLESVFKKLRLRSRDFLKTAESLGLQEDIEEMRYALEAWSTLTFDAFFRSLKAGRALWIKEESRP